jgi:hypothetical protein
VTTFTVPAAYAREIEHAIARAVQLCTSDAKLRDGSEPFPRGILEAWEIDEQATGEIVITLQHHDVQKINEAA